MKYNYKVEWSYEDGEYLALCSNYPSLSFFEECPIKALNGLINIIEKIEMGIL